MVKSWNPRYRPGIAFIARSRRCLYGPPRPLTRVHGEVGDDNEFTTAATSPTPSSRACLSQRERRAT